MEQNLKQTVLYTIRTRYVYVTHHCLYLVFDVFFLRTKVCKFLYKKRLKLLNIKFIYYMLKLSFFFKHVKLSPTVVYASKEKKTNKYL